MLNKPQLINQGTRIGADAARSHRAITAAALAGSAVLIGLGGLIAPPNDGQAADLYEAATAAAGRLVAEAVILVISSVALVIGVIGAARVVIGRGQLLAGAAALFGVMGAMGHVAYATFSLITVPMAESAPDRESALRTLESINSDAAVGLLVMPLMMAYGLSVLLLPIAFYRRGLVPIWVVGLAGLAFVLEVAAPGEILALTALKYAFAAAAAVALAWRIRKLSESQWRRPETIPTD